MSLIVPKRNLSAASIDKNSGHLVKPLSAAERRASLKKSGNLTLT